MDHATQQHFHGHVISLYRRLARLRADGRCTDDEILNIVQLPCPDVLLRRARLGYLVTLIKANHDDAWTMLARDSYSCGLLEEDLVWMWQQLRHVSDLRDPREHYPQWLQLMQTSPGSWKRLLRRACEHSVRQLMQTSTSCSTVQVQALQIFHANVDFMFNSPRTSIADLPEDLSEGPL